MKVKNDFIAIKNGKEEIKIQNTILDTYIENIIKYQFEIDKTGLLNMKYIFLKFDEGLNFNEHSNLTKSNFDLGLGILATDYPITETSSKEIINNYRYTFFEGNVAVDIKNGIAIDRFKQYNGRKVTAIGFGAYIDGNIYACVDTTNYDIYYDATQVFSVERRDILSTDGYIYSTNEILKEPIHLCAYKEVIENGEKKRYSAIINSVGLGNNPFKMVEEHTLIPYEEHIQLNISSIIINDELTVEKQSEGLFPSNKLYPTVGVYPARIIKDNLYPSEHVYPGIDVYPVYAAYQYVQLKYEIYKSSGGINYEDTGDYYLLSVPIGNKEKIKLNILYERA